MEKLIDLDGYVLLYIQEHIRNVFLTPVFKVITSLGNAGMIWIVITAILIVMTKTRRTGMIAAGSLFSSFIVDNLVLKNVVARVRPYHVIEGLHILIREPSDFSFPSGHTGSSFAVAVVLFLLLPKKYGISAVVLAFAIAFSRLYVGVHYPTDVIGGMVIGTSLAIFFVKLFAGRTENLNN